MNVLQSIILGLIEGFTEFLPISSTAHLIVAQKLMGLGEVNEFFTTVVQLGAILAVIVYFFGKIRKLFLDLVVYAKKPAGQSIPIAIWLLIATMPVLVIGFLIRHKISSIHNSIPLIAFMSIAIGVVLAIAQWYSKRKKTNLLPTHYQLLSMGLWQVLALLPGASRSGTVIAGGLFAGLSFQDALEYSFLLSIPALLAAGGFELLSAIKTPPTSDVLMMTAVAFVVAFIAALVSIKFLLASVRKLGFLPFVVYRIIFGILILFLV